jgi:hypothetical protein
MEPTDKEIEKYMKEHNENYYAAREVLRERAYGKKYGNDKPAHQSWGDYWKGY